MRESHQGYPTLLGSDRDLPILEDLIIIAVHRGLINAILLPLNFMLLFL